ncbi:MAG: zinc metallopeptidase [Planctomycetes bacterium]|nr:zinc metallopeptidase [Planctomycetota bacterium]MBI3835622.1 zinc metallopeptidase [Planctomycetota bacterium]
MFYFDPLYFLIVSPAILLALWAQWKVKSAYADASRIPSRSGLTGAGTAQRILNAFGVTDVAIEPVNSFLGDHYDSRHKVLRLSPEVYHGNSLAAVGIAAHEVGHAIQDATAYAPLAFRNGLVPMASIGSNFSFMLIIIGFFLHMTGLAVAGLALFSVVVLFQIVNLPVEFNASSRARAILLENGIISMDEDKVVAKVLNAAAMTYVAATITAILTLLYYVLRVFGDRR